MSNGQQIEPLPVPNKNNLAFGQEANFGLRLEVFSGTTAKLEITGLTKDSAFTFRQLLVGGGTRETFNFRIPDMPIAVSVVEQGNILEGAEAFGTLSLTVANTKIQELCAGIINEQRGISYPVSNSHDALDGIGFLNTVQGTNPAAGLESEHTTPSQAVWRIRCINVILVTDANVADRNVHLNISDAVSDTFHFYGAQVQVASTTRKWVFEPIGAVPPAVNGDEILVPIPTDLLVSNQSSIATHTTNLQAADDFQSLFMYVEQFWSPTG